MKPLLLHGLAKAASRKKLIELKQKLGVNNVVIFEEGANIGEIKTALSSQSLFADEQLIILENPSLELTFDSLTLHDSLNLILWFDKEIDTKKWPGFEYLFFPEGKEVSVFPFLDLLANKETKAFVELEKLKTAGFDIYFCLTMVFYLLRSLAVTPKNAPSFVKGKLERQRRNFSLEKITELYKEMLEIDFKIKSGLLEIPQAEFLLISKFL